MYSVISSYYLKDSTAVLYCHFSSTKKSQFISGRVAEERWRRVTSARSVRPSASDESATSSRIVSKQCSGEKSHVDVRE